MKFKGLLKYIFSFHLLIKINNKTTIEILDIFQGFSQSQENKESLFHSEMEVDKESTENG